MPRQLLLAVLQGAFEFLVDADWYDAADLQPGAQAHEDHVIVSWLKFYLAKGFDEFGAELSADDKTEIRAAIKRLTPDKPSIRSAVGLGNPPHSGMLPLFEKAAMSPRDTSRDLDDWLMSPSRRFQTHSPNSRNPDPVPTVGHSKTVMGHDEGASNYWNREGHKLPPGKLRAYNQDLTSYHGLEQRAKSNKSGGGTPRFIHPSRALGSWEGYWNSKHPDFKEDYSKLWPETIE